MATEILKLADGAITNITDDSWKSDGCPTCDYGAEYIIELYLTTTKLSIEIYFRKEFEYVSIAEIMSIFLNNASDIMAMTEQQFADWLIETLDEHIGIFNSEVKDI